jgi:hypothetical protein
VSMFSSRLNLLKTTGMVPSLLHYICGMTP